MVGSGSPGRKYVREKEMKNKELIEKLWTINQNEVFRTHES